MKKGNHKKARSLHVGCCMAARRGARFVRPEGAGEDLRLDEGDLIAYDGDTVAYRIIHRRGRKMAELVEIIKRAREQFTAVVRRRDKLWYLEPVQDGLEDMVPLRDKPEGCGEGMLVLARVCRWPSAAVGMLAQVEQVFGAETEPRAMLMGIAGEYGFPAGFGAKVEAECGRLANLPDPPRRDLRDTVLFTIDGDDAQDFDDAVSLVWEKGHRILGVHIADVSHYVRRDMFIDKEARARGTSLYLPGYTVPMLPEKLCNDLCSLRPHEDRRAMTLMADMDTGRAELFPSMIRSRARLTYRQVNALFEGRENDVPDELQAVLMDMLRLSREMRSLRESRGAVEFDLPEIGFDMDENGRPVECHVRQRGEAEKMIEDFMLLANEQVARMAQENDLAFAYRVHESPDNEKLAQLSPLLSALGLKTKLGADPAPVKIQRLLKEAEEKGKSGTISPALLRCMQRARYDERPLGHYALAMEDYCHFTSPIRRYPDLLVHRALKNMLSGKGILSCDMREECEHASQRERAAVLAEREGDDLCACLALEGHEGEIFQGVVAGVSRGAFFVRLDCGAEGCVPYRLMTRPAQSDETLSRVILGRGETLTMGDRIQVRLTQVNIPLRELTFLPG